MLASILLSFIGWSVLPDLLTSITLRVLPLLPFPFSFSHPPTSQRYRVTFALVVLSYLTYTLLVTSLSVLPNYYQRLGVFPNADDAGLRTAYKAWVRGNHPDKRGGGPEAEEAFRVVQEGFEILRDPVKRFAYDHFGPDVLRWSHSSTLREYVQYGLLQASGYHIVLLAGLIGFNAIGKPSNILYWRYLLYLYSLFLELSILLSTSPLATPYVLRTLFPRRVAYQHILVLHQCFMFFSIAISRVCPVLWPEQRRQGMADTLKITAKRSRKLLGVLEDDVNQMLTAELMSLRSPPRTLSLFGTSPLPHRSRQRPAFTPAQPRQTLPELEVMGRLAREMEDMIVEMSVRDASLAAEASLSHAGDQEERQERVEKATGRDVPGTPNAEGGSGQAIWAVVWMAFQRLVSRRTEREPGGAKKAGHIYHHERPMESRLSSAGGGTRAGRWDGQDGGPFSSPGGGSRARRWDGQDGGPFSSPGSRLLQPSNSGSWTGTAPLEHFPGFRSTASDQMYARARSLSC